MMGVESRGISEKERNCPLLVKGTKKAESHERAIITSNQERRNGWLPFISEGIAPSTFTFAWPKGSVSLPFSPRNVQADLQSEPGMGTGINSGDSFSSSIFRPG
jgi:hypothetical protein